MHNQQKISLQTPQYNQEDSIKRRRCINRPSQRINTKQMSTIGQQINDRTGADIGVERKQQVKRQNKQKHMTGNQQHVLRG